MDKSKLAIFDLDGTLFDTKNVNFNAYNKALKMCGFDVVIDYQFYCNFCNGNNYKVFLPKIVEDITPNEMQNVHAKKLVLYKDFLHLARLNNHLFSMIKLMREDYIVAIATTASQKNVNDILGVFKISKYFDIIITQEDVENTKPAPDCFLLAVERANVNLRDTIIFEDSEVGLEAAKASGAEYVKVYGYS